MLTSRRDHLQISNATAHDAHEDIPVSSNKNICSVRSLRPSTNIHFIEYGLLMFLPESVAPMALTIRRLVNMLQNLVMSFQGIGRQVHFLLFAQVLELISGLLRM